MLGVRKGPRAQIWGRLESEKDLTDSREQLRAARNRILMTAGRSRDRDPLPLEEGSLPHPGLSQVEAGQTPDLHS